MDVIINVTAFGDSQYLLRITTIKYVVIVSLDLIILYEILLHFS
jgi:hypothetical protein